MTMPSLDPVRSPRSQTRFPLTLAIVLVVALLASRMPMARTALEGSELTTDEPDLTLMALDRYFGAPLTNTHWPAITNQLLMVPSIGVDFVKTGQPRTVDGFAKYAGERYRNERPLVFVHRWTIIGLTTLATAILAWSLRRYGVVAMLAAALLLQNTHLVTYGTLGLGNGPALAAMACMVAALVSRRFFVAGLMLGIAVASRNTSILALPIVIGFAWERGVFARRLGAGLVGVVIGSSLAWGPAILDPIRWTKGNLGNFVKVGEPAGLATSARVLFETGGAHTVVAGAWWLATLAAIVWLLRARRRIAVVVGFVVAVALAVVISARSPLVETRYFDAIVLGSAVVILLACIELAAKLPSHDPIGGVVDEDHTPTAVRRGVAMAVAVFLGGLGWWGAGERFRLSTEGLHPIERTVAASLPAPAGKVVIDRSLLAFVLPRASSESLREIADATDRAMRDGTALREFVERFKLDPAVAQVFAASLSEKEQTEIVRRRVAAVASPVGVPLDVIPVGDSNAARRYGCASVSAGIAMVREGAAAEAIVTQESIQEIDLTGLVTESVWTERYLRVRRK